MCATAAGAPGARRTAGAASAAPGSSTITSCRSGAGGPARRQMFDCFAKRTIACRRRWCTVGRPSGAASSDVVRARLEPSGSRNSRASATGSFGRSTPLLRPSLQPRMAPSVCSSSGSKAAAPLAGAAASLTGASCFMPDASTAGPPWVCGGNRVSRRRCAARHQDDVSRLVFPASYGDVSELTPVPAGSIATGQSLSAGLVAAVSQDACRWPRVCDFVG